MHIFVTTILLNGLVETTTYGSVVSSSTLFGVVDVGTFYLHKSAKGGNLQASQPPQAGRCLGSHGMYDIHRYSQMLHVRYIYDVYIFTYISH